MPNPKTGTVTDDTAKAVNEVKAGRVEFKIDKTANLHVPVGKVSFEIKKLTENIQSVIEAVIRAKPSSSKGRFVHNCYLSATMSPSVRLDIREYVKVA
jgi:large subunit ribosomal protein L1